MRLQMFVFAYLMLQLHFHGYFALNPEGVSLLAFRSKVEIDSFEALQNWDRRDDDPCEWNGVHCVDGRVGTLNLEGMKLGGTLTPEIGKLGHLKALLLCGKNFEGGTHSWTEKNIKNFQLKTNKNHPCDVPGAINCMKSKFGHNFWRRGLQNCKGGSFVILSKGKFLDSFDVWFVSKLKNKYSHRRGGKIQNNLLTTSYISLHMVRRHLLQESKNLPSATGSSSPPHTVSVPSHGSGSFAAIPNSEGSGGRKTPSTDPSYKPNTLVEKESKSASRSWPKWIFTLIIPTIIIIFIIIMALIVVYQRNSTAIDAWRTGLSGPLRNAFITGVPKLNRAELEAACEDFSNITIIYPNCTVFKGILSSGVEIAVASTKAKSQFDWSERSDSQFRNKIDTISRINHKNFVNLLGYCQEDDPFMRMMVFEYAPNGTLFEHLHVKEFEHLDWSTRMRIIMGIGYCLQHMHDLNPAVAHPILQSNCIFLTDDYAAKIADLGIFSEPIGKETDFLKDKDNSVPAPTSDPESNVYSFGILLLEIISGRMPISEDNGLPISDWAMEHLKDTKSIKSLVDPSLTFNKDNELHIICKVAEACIQEDSKCRPTMKEVSALLREVLRIEPEAAVPRLSPLWWAELEILSVEAS